MQFMKEESELRTLKCPLSPSMSKLDRNNLANINKQVPCVYRESYHRMIRTVQSRCKANNPCICKKNCTHRIIRLQALLCRMSLELVGLKIPFPILACTHTHLEKKPSCGG